MATEGAEKTGTTAARQASSLPIALVRRQGWPAKKRQGDYRWSLACRLVNSGHSSHRRRENMRLKTCWIALGLLLTLIAGTLLTAQGRAAALQARHSAAWYRTHRRHSAAWYRRHRHTAAWYRAHPQYSEEWYETHPRTVAFYRRYPQHSAAWYRTHRRHSAAWYRRHHLHTAAWYRTHRRHSAAWYRRHRHTAAWYRTHHH